MARKQHKYHYLYKTTNLINSKFYVGMHSTDNINDGYLGSGKYIASSIRKHGRKNFSFEILEFFDNRLALKAREKEYVHEKFILDPMCMNLKPGGDGGFCNEEHRLKCSKAGNKALAEKVKNDPIYLAKVQQVGRETLAIIKANGINSYGFKDKTHSEETKSLMSEKAKLNIGSKNSQFGTCWIYNDIESKKIKQDELNIHLSNGWLKGRKMF